MPDDDEDYPSEAFRVLRGLGARSRRTPGEDPTRDAIEVWATEFLADPGEPTPADLALVDERIALVRSPPNVPPEPGDELEQHPIRLRRMRA